MAAPLLSFASRQALPRLADGALTSRLPQVVSRIRLRADVTSVAGQMPGLVPRIYADPEMTRELAALLRRPFARDAGLAGLLGGLSLILSWAALTKLDGDPKIATAFGSLGAWHRDLAVWLAASLVMLGALPLRRRYPAGVLAVTLAMGAVHSAGQVFGPSPADLAVPVAVYTLAAVAPRRVSLFAAAAGLALAAGTSTLLGPVLAPGTEQVAKLGGGWLAQPADIAMTVLILAVAWFAGDGTRTRRDYLAALQRRALDAERDRDRQAELAAAAERSRITGELHDIIAHALSVIVIQAQGAGAALRQHHPAETGEALDTIVSSGRGALAETRRLLGVVRQAPGSRPELAPLPRLAGLTELVAGVRRAGTPVELHVEGAARPLEAVVELSAYRIIQEALTNTIKHAGPAATATVRVRYGVSELGIEVTDDGPGPPARHQVTAGGHGLAGMLTRAATLGGELTTGPADGVAGTGPAGFRVRARLPLRVPQDAQIPDTGQAARSGQIPPAPPARRVPAG